MLVLSAPVGLTFDMRAIMPRPPLAGSGLTGALVLLAFVIGFGIKTPLFPVHTWLPPAHVNAPGPVSAILAGVLLKMGTYGLIRLADANDARASLPTGRCRLRWWRSSRFFGARPWRWGQRNLKRRIAYTSVNHMGYAVLGIAVAGSALGSGGGAWRWR